MTLIDSWADVEALIAMLLPPEETIAELYSLEIAGGVSAATLDWLEGGNAMRQSLATSPQDALQRTPQKEG